MKVQLNGPSAQFGEAGGGGGSRADKPEYPGEKNTQKTPTTGPKNDTMHHHIYHLYTSLFFEGKGRVDECCY